VETGVSEIRQLLYRGDREGAWALVDGGAEPNVFDAAALGDTDRLAAILAADRALVEAWSADGFTALHFAAFLGGPDAVRLLLDAGADVGDVARNEMRVQPLHSAAANGNVESCRLLLEAGADPRARQQGDYTPMDEAVQEHNVELMELLRSYGA
jgi:ankyrin repeat protein